MTAAKTSAAVGTDFVEAILTGVGFTRNHCTSALPESGWAEVLWFPLNGPLWNNCSAARICMQTVVSLTALGLLLVCGCAGEKEMRFIKGKGDVGQFIIQQALKRGAHPIATNSLPVVGGDWSYSEDEYGVVLHLPRERFSEVEAFLQQAFGAPAQEAIETTDGGKLGWYSPKAIGVALQFGYDSNLTQVIVLHPQPPSEIIKRIPEAIERAGK